MRCLLKLMAEAIGKAEAFELTSCVAAVRDDETLLEAVAAASEKEFLADVSCNESSTKQTPVVK